MVPSAQPGSPSGGSPAGRRSALIAVTIAIAVLFFVTAAGDATVAPPDEDSPYLSGVGGVGEPRLVHRVEPEYPKRARGTGIRARAILNVVVLADGTVGEAEVLRCLPRRQGFEDAALRAVRQWRYEPALRNGEPVDVYLTVFLEIEEPRGVKAPATPPPESGPAAEPDPGPADQPPRPLADNPRPDYPQQAQEAGIEGSVTFSAHIDPQGRVTEVTIHEVPAPDFGFEQSVRETVSAWRFEPARREGRPTSGEYLGSAGFFQHLDPDRARMYDLPAESVWTEMLALLKELGIKARWHSVDEESGLVVTKWTRFKSGKFDRPVFRDLPEGQRAVDFKLNVFIPRVSEPARVYIDSVIRAQVEQPYRVAGEYAYATNNIFSAGAVESWLFERLEARLQRRGAMIPSGYARRREVASTLLGAGPDERCAELVGDLVFVPGVDGVTKPEDLWPSSRDELGYPAQMVLAGQGGDVVLLALISPDGRIDDLQFADSSDLGHADFIHSALASFYSWRFKPALREGCPVPVYVTLRAEYLVAR